MKKFLKRAVKITAVILPLVLIAFTFMVRTDHNKVRMEGFYLEEENSLDVVLMGASEIYTGFSSALAYDEYGFTSYPYAVESNYIELFKTQLEEIRRTQSPKLIVIETNGMLFDRDVSKDDAKFRKYVENIPPSKNKDELLNRYADKDNILSYYFPFIKYHGSEDSFKEIGNDFSMNLRGYSYLKGVSTSTSKPEHKKLIDVEKSEKKKAVTPKCEKNLREFLSFCKEEGFDNLVFARFPHRISSKKSLARFEKSNYVGEIIKESGYEYINFDSQKAELGLDVEKDFYNDEHMNIYGQQKLTRRLSELFRDKYGISETKLSEKSRKRWDESAQYIKLYYKYFENCQMESPNGKKGLFERSSLIRELNKLKDADEDITPSYKKHKAQNV